MKTKFEEAIALWNENKTKVIQVAVVGIVGGFAVKTAYKLGNWHGTVGTIGFVKENIPEAYALIEGYFKASTL